ncbi:integrator complex subunit 11 [Dendrobium catenatum]|uniref:Integrator complex subunit 11 n=1 Tax=Dendrobium catenatum TaxID=906689 RepID=A0A2I0VFR5_9ASPA|nr:integrator complex subunit 11 [Dendrobium catenatum]
MEDFNVMINDCHLNDIGFCGSPFTWNRANLFQRLDRFLFNHEWLAKFSATNVEHLSRTLSDHAPLLLNINVINHTGNFAFRFLNMWLLHDNFNMVLENNWATAGPDGFTTKFFQKSWDIVKEDVIFAVQDFFRGNPYPKFFSSSNIVLIPKIDGAKRWSEFRPISLCTFFNKLNSKIIASRLTTILPKIISLNQTGFVKGRSISDNVLLAQELVNDINSKVPGGNIVFKLDITKAYDNLDWNFLYKILSLFGFSQDFILLIRNSVDNCFFSVIINGRNHGFLNPLKVLDKVIRFLLLFLL